MSDETVADLKAKRKKLDARIAAAEGREERLTPARVREMSREEARQELEARGLRPREPDEDRITPAGRTARLNRAYESSDPKARREERQEGRGARAGLEGGADDE